MKLNIYAIKDELANNFGNLMIVNPTVADRTFLWMAKEMEEGDTVDRRVYYMGEYDTERGFIAPVNPVMKYNLEKMKKEQKDGKNL